MSVRCVMTLRQSLKKKIDKAKPVDIIVGISAKNVDSTIVHVMNVAATGLVEYFSDYKALMVISDGFSTDRTVELAKLFELPGGISKIVTEDINGVGKGSGVRTIFEVAVEAEADTIVLLDGDLLSVHPEWIEHLGKPSIYGVADLVVPYYIRHKYDGVITNHLAFPLTRALYGANIRQPISGDYGLSLEFATKLLENPLFPSHFGIDIFMTTIAAAENYAIQESLLGLKLHESVLKYVDPGKHLIPMFRQVVGQMMDMMELYESKWKDERVSRQLCRVMAKNIGQKATPVHVDVDKFNEVFMEGYPDHEALLKSGLPPDVFKELKKATKESTVNIEPHLWVKLVYNLAAMYKKAEDSRQKVRVLDALRKLWLGRFASFVVETKGMSGTKTEKVLEQQAEIFEQEIEYLKSIY